MAEPKSTIPIARKKVNMYLPWWRHAFNRRVTVV